ncbi:MAG: CoA-binding protein [Lautropia sp.]
MMADGYDALFAPAAIAIVGASSDQRKFGNRTIRILQRHRFAGAIYPVHGREHRIEGLTAYPSLDRVPTPPTLTVICVPAAAVPAAVDQACAAGARAIVVHSSGFRETGDAGRELEAAIVRRCSDSGVVLLGPNCQGSANFHNGAVVNFSIAMLDRMPAPSGLAVIGQSGLLGTVLTESLRRHGGVQAGMLVATGNEAQADTLSLATYLARSRPEVTALLLHIENVGSLAALEALAVASSESRKPVCILKVGRTAAGGRAAASHTGSMPVDERVFASACARLGLRQVRSIEEAARAGRLMVQAPRDTRRGGRVAIVSNSGGVAALFADLVSDAGLEVATLAPSTQAALAAFLPGQEAGGFNPSDVNVLPYTDPPRYAQVLQLAAQDPGVDQILLFLGMQRSSIEPIARSIGSVQRETGKPVLACTMGCSPEIAGLLHAEGVVAVDDSSAAVE